MLDPLVAVAVLLRQRVGLVLGICVLVLDVAVNTTVAVVRGETGPGLVTQPLFLLFLCCTVRVLWRQEAAAR